MHVGVKIMKRIVLFLVVVAAAVSSCAPVEQPGFASHDHTSLLAANAKYDRAMISADAAALESIYSDDFSFIGDKAELRNKRQQISYMTDGSVRVLSAASDQVDVTPLGSNYALLTGRLIGRFSAGDKEADFVERYTNIWVRQGSRWRLRHEHSSLVPS